MATYFCSDLHGEYELFMRLLDEVNLGGSDDVYVLGDVVDKGRDSFRLMEFMRQNGNMKVLCGNHEYAFLQFYHDFMAEDEGENGYDGVLARLQETYKNDSARLTWDLVDYIDALPYYFSGDDFLCVHAGLQPDGKGGFLPLARQLPQFFLYDRRFKEESTVYRGEKTVLFGHTPCCYENGTGEFIKTLKEGRVSGRELSDFSKIRLDCGVAFTGMLGMLRKEDMREFYVRSED